MIYEQLSRVFQFPHRIRYLKVETSIGRGKNGFMKHTDPHRDCSRTRNPVSVVYGRVAPAHGSRLKIPRPIYWTSWKRMTPLDENLLLYWSYREMRNEWNLRHFKRYVDLKLFSCNYYSGRVWPYIIEVPCRRNAHYRWLHSLTFIVLVHFTKSLLCIRI